MNQHIMGSQREVNAVIPENFAPGIKNKEARYIQRRYFRRLKE